MAKEFFKDLPNTTTPLTASRINGLLDGEEAMGSIVVDDVNCKNMFNKYSYNSLDAYITSGSVITANANSKSIYVKCKPNTTYTVSRIVDQRFAVGTTTNVPALGMTCNNSITNHTASSITITTGANDNYLVVYYFTSSATSTTAEAILDSMQIEVGSSASTYTNYKGIIKEQNGYVKEDTTFYANDFKCKNLFNINSTPTWLSGNDMTWSVSDNELTVSGKYYIGFLVDVKANTNYYMSATRTIVTSSTNAGSIRIFKKDKTSSITPHNTGNFTFNTGDNTQIYVLFYTGGGSTGVVKFSNIQLETGTEATSYTEYKNFDATIKMFQINGTTSSNGNINTSLDKNSTVVLCANLNSNNAIATFYAYSSNNNWTLHCSQVASGQALANTEISGIIFYLEL